VAALIVQAHARAKGHGFLARPGTVRSILLMLADRSCLPGRWTEIYTDEGRPAEFDAVCDGTTANNGLYGEGIVNAAAAVART